VHHDCPSNRFARLATAAFVASLGASAGFAACSSSEDPATTNGDAGNDATSDVVTVPDAEIPDGDVADTLGPHPPPCSSDAGVLFGDGGPPLSIADIGLYTSLATKTLDPAVQEFQPQFPLWSDGAVKTRWVRLPDQCNMIDTADEDNWSLPVGTRLFKQFVIDGKMVETRMIARVGPGNTKADYVFAAYAWNDTETDATYAPNGVENARGTDHDVPATADCWSCHGYLPAHSLGFSAIQLNHAPPGLTLAQLASDGHLSGPPPTDYVVPGDATASAALGYLHANCGHCHNPNGVPLPGNAMDLRLTVGARTVEQTGVWRTAVNQPVTKFVYPGVTHRIKGGSTNSSCVYVRMSQRGTLSQMPPIASEYVDDAGIATLSAWISALPAP
jgi:cytochrome c553